VAVTETKTLQDESDEPDATQGVFEPATGSLSAVGHGHASTLVLALALALADSDSGSSSARSDASASTTDPQSPAASPIVVQVQVQVDPLAWSRRVAIAAYLRWEAGLDSKDAQSNWLEAERVLKCAALPPPLPLPLPLPLGA
jgi:hypothetical protein